MALFKRFFFRKPPDGLLEISERVYVFDHCFSTEVLREDEYKEYMGGIVKQIRSHFPDASFMVFNFWDGESESQISSILSEFDMTVMDYPRHYEGCPLLKMEMVHHFLRSCESWLCLGHQNFLLMHCERGGWPIMAFMLAALLIYLKEYTGEQKTLDMIYKQAPHELLQFLSPLNPVPSQLRYLQYVSRSVASEWPPLDRALTLDCIILRMIPIFDSLGGCRPIFRIYGQDPFFLSDKTTKVLFSTPKKSKLVRHYKQADCEIVKIDIGCHIQGDIVIECISLDEDLEREAMMFRVVLNTAFIRSNILMLNRDQIDILWDTKDRFPKGFRAEVLLSEMDSGSSLTTMEVSHVEDKVGLPMEAFAKVHEIFSHLDWLEGKGDAALHIIQKISACNSSKEKLDEIPQQKVQSSNPLDSGFDILSKKIHFDGKNNLATSEISGPELPESPELLLHSSSLSTPRPLPPSLPPPLELLKTVSPSLTGSDENVMQSAMLQHPLPPPPPSLAPLPPSSQLPFSTSMKQNILITQSHITRAAASINIMSPPLPPTPPPPPPPPPPKLTPQRANQTILAPSLSFLNSAPLSETTQPSDLPSTKSVSSIHIPSSRRQPVSEQSSDIGNNLSADHPQPQGCTLPSAPPPPPPPPRPAILSSPPPVIPSSPLLPPSPPHPPPSPMKKTRMTSTPPPPPPPLPHHMLKQSDAPSLLTPTLSSSSSALRTSQSNSTQFVPPPPIAAFSPLNSMSSSNKGKSLSRTKSSRSLHSTQSSSRRTSLKPLHWVKVTRAMSGSLWAETQKSDELSKTLEIDMLELESLFSAGVPNSDASGLAEKSKHRSSLGGKSEKVHLIDLRRANNCEIMLTKVKVPIPDLMSLVLALDDSILDVDQVDNLIKFCPTKEEMELLQGYKGDKESLGKCEQFFLELMKVPRVESKLRVFSFKLQFHIQVNDLRSNLNTINSATDEIQSSVKLKRVMQTILSLGNALNQGTARGSAIGFRLDSLLKLSDTRARNNKMTLMHYLCKVLADKLPEVLDFHKDLVSLEAASKIQLKIMAEEMQAVTKGLEKVEEELTSSESDGPVSKTFRETLMAFLVIAEAEVRSLTSLYTGVGRNADALARYFGEDPARCSFEQVVSTLFNFIRMFERAHDENCRQLELERKKVQKEAEQEKLRLAQQKKESEHVLQSPNRSGKSKR